MRFCLFRRCSCSNPKRTSAPFGCDRAVYLEGKLSTPAKPGRSASLVEEPRCQCQSERILSVADARIPAQLTHQVRHEASMLSPRGPCVGSIPFRNSRSTRLKAASTMCRTASARGELMPSSFKRCWRWGEIRYWLPVEVRRVVVQHSL